MANIELSGFSTSENKFDMLRGYKMAIEDVVNELNTDIGECDWDPQFGSSARKVIFTIKTDMVRDQIVNEVREILKHNYFTCESFTYEEYDKGWTFYFKIKYMNEVPLTWVLQKSIEKSPYVSNGIFPLVENK